MTTPPVFIGFLSPIRPKWPEKNLIRPIRAYLNFSGKNGHGESGVSYNDQKKYSKFVRPKWSQILFLQLGIAYIICIYWIREYGTFLAMFYSIFGAVLVVLILNATLEFLVVCWKSLMKNIKSWLAFNLLSSDQITADIAGHLETTFTRKSCEK